MTNFLAQKLRGVSVVWGYKGTMYSILPSTVSPDNMSYSY